jgi:DNA-binding beta-propeller fold protein YncE
MFDTKTGKAAMSPFLTDLSTPRYITGSGNKIYITNWGEGVDDGSGWWIFPNAYVLVVNYPGWTVDRKIDCGSDAEDILYINGKLYVATGEGIAVINPETDQVELINTPAGLHGGAKSFALSPNRLWASYPNDEKLVAINLANNTVAGTYDMPLDWSGKITYNYSGTKIYSYKTEFDAFYNPLRAAIYEFDVESKTYREFWGADGAYFYSVGVSPLTGNVYTADVNNFMGNSLLLVLNSSGVKIDQKTVGVGTNGMRFLQRQQ